MVGLLLAIVQNEPKEASAKTRTRQTSVVPFPMLFTTVPVEA